ncbi:MAG: alpha/beta fold hydrolase [Gemmatimonadetes bacterium]|nr:alpha/beta fold hydrolase [Gemmatimonadota bacterium]
MSMRQASGHTTNSFELESGEVLTDLVQCYHLDGDLSADRDNLVVVFHALTGGPDAVGDWWRSLAQPGGALDTRRNAVLCVNLLGSCYGTRWRQQPRAIRPRITPRDMARAVRLVVESLNVSTVSLAVGGSLGGMVALEWALISGELTRHTVSIAAPAAHTASAIAWNGIQRQAIGVGGAKGLALARQVAMMTYRTGAELEERFGRARAGGGFQVERYLRHHGQKLVSRFDAGSYLTLLDAMDAHDVGRGRGGIDAALRHAGSRLTGVAIPGDLLYPSGNVRRWTDAAGAHYAEIRSIHGHDAFLIEFEQVDSIISAALARATAAA